MSRLSFPVRPIAATETTTWAAGPLLAPVRSRTAAIKAVRAAGFRVIRSGGLAEVIEESRGHVWAVTVRPEA